jgi:hypothetical protein
MFGFTAVVGVSATPVTLDHVYATLKVRLFCSRLFAFTCSAW